MINIKATKLKCREDIELIQNYDKAISDDTQIWDCHHRLGIVIPKKKLLEMDLYYHRPALELIFIPKIEHRILHGLNRREETRKKQSESMKGKPKSEATKRKLSESLKGRIFSESSIQRMREAAKRRWLKYHYE